MTIVVDLGRKATKTNKRSMGQTFTKCAGADEMTHFMASRRCQHSLLKCQESIIGITYCAYRNSVNNVFSCLFSYVRTNCTMTIKI